MWKTEKLCWCLKITETLIHYHLQKLDMPMDSERACSWMTFCMQTCSGRIDNKWCNKVVFIFPCLSNPTENGKSHYRSENICSLLYAKSLQYIKTWSCQICFYKQTIKWHIQFWTFFLFKKWQLFDQIIKIKIKSVKRSLCWYQFIICRHHKYN